MVLPLPNDLPGAPAAWAARLSEPGSPVCSPDWLALREPADHVARSADLAADLAAALDDRLASPPGGGDDEVVVRDLGCGSGSMARWLGPRLSIPQHWYTHDRDDDLAHRAAATAPLRATAVVGDLRDLTDLAGTDVVVCSALLDLLDAPALEHLAELCATAGAAALLTLSVTGEVTIDPADPLDAAVAAAFDAHQRRDSRLGPDAPAVVADTFARRGFTVTRRASPWRLGGGDAGLVEEWLRGRLDAACAQDPSLASYAAPYLERRLTALGVGTLHAEVGHADLLALPAAGGDR